MMIRRYTTEFIGTFFLTFAITLTPNPLAIGLILAAMVYMGKHISGGHYNPAVTLSFFIRKKIDLINGLFYMASQSLGAFAAAVLFYALSENTFFPTPLSTLALWHVILLEALFTFILCIVILTMTTSEHLRGNYAYGLVIGLTLTCIIATGGQLSGGVFNPAVGLGTIAWDMVSGSGKSLNYLAMYLIGPFIGGLLAPFVYQFINFD